MQTSMDEINDGEMDLNDLDLPTFMRNKAQEEMDSE
jgi:hypothetical protein